MRRGVARAAAIHAKRRSALSGKVELARTAGWPDIPANGLRERLRGSLVLGRASLLAWFAVAVLTAGCVSSSRREAPRGDLSTVVPIGFPGTIRSVGETRHRFETQARPLLAALRAAARDGPINILALSGGGAGGAYGAGVLVGLSRQGTRPQFNVVTGVSAGALIAPFAFLGPSWDCRLADAFSGRNTRNLLKLRWASGFVDGSVYRGEPLAELVDRFVTDQMVHEVAAEAAKGRILLVATTDLDRAQTVVWNLGAIALNGESGARALFRDVLLASASIPGLFPPVLIRVRGARGEYDEMHVDGGTTGSLFVAPEIAAIVPNALDDLKSANVYVLVNGQFGTVAQTTPLRTIPILRRSVTASLESEARRSVDYASSLAQHYDMHVRVTDIPDDYPYLGPLDLEPAHMEALFGFAARCAEEGATWTTPVDVLDRAEHAQLRTAGGPARCPGGEGPDLVPVSSH